MAEVVVDASAVVDLLLGNDLGHAVGARIAGSSMHAPAHLPAEVLSALGRLHRAGELGEGDVESMLHQLVSAPIDYRPVRDLLTGSWGRRHQLRLVDALYVELAVDLEADLVTTDRRLRDAPSAVVVRA